MIRTMFLFHHIMYGKSLIQTHFTEKKFDVSRTMYIYKKHVLCFKNMKTVIPSYDITTFKDTTVVKEWIRLDETDNWKWGFRLSCRWHVYPLIYDKNILFSLTYMGTKNLQKNAQRKVHIISTVDHFPILSFICLFNSLISYHIKRPFIFTCFLDNFPSLVKIINDNA